MVASNRAWILTQLRNASTRPPLRCQSHKTPRVWGDHLIGVLLPSPPRDVAISSSLRCLGLLPSSSTSETRWWKFYQIQCGRPCTLSPPKCPRQLLS